MWIIENVERRQCCSQKYFKKFSHLLKRGNALVKQLWTFREGGLWKILWLNFVILKLVLFTNAIFLKFLLYYSGALRKVQRGDNVFKIVVAELRWKRGGSSAIWEKVGWLNHECKGGSVNDWTFWEKKCWERPLRNIATHDRKWAKQVK